MPKLEDLSRILVVSDAVAATQRISFAQPLADLKEGLKLQDSGLAEYEIQAKFSQVRPDLLVLSRLTLPEGAVWIGAARRAGVSVLYHIDDDLLAVPLSLGPDKYDIYNAPERLAALRANLEGSDLIYASTAPLAEALRGHGLGTPVAAGQLYCSVDPGAVRAGLPPSDIPTLGYMGTAGHAADLAEILPAIEALMHKIPELNFELFGGLTLPPALRRFAGRVRVLPPVADYAAFLDRMRALGWWVGLAPLQDTGFNRCKADTKWVEYSLAGIATLAADLPVYAGACAGGAGVLAGDLNGWQTEAEALILNAPRRHAMVEAAQRKLKTGYSHAALKTQIADILRKLPGHAA